MTSINSNPYPPFKSWKIDMQDLENRVKGCSPNSSLVQNGPIESYSANFLAIGLVDQDADIDIDEKLKRKVFWLKTDVNGLISEIEDCITEWAKDLIGKNSKEQHNPEKQHTSRKIFDPGKLMDYAYSIIETSWSKPIPIDGFSRKFQQVMLMKTCAAHLCQEVNFGIRGANQSANIEEIVKKWEKEYSSMVDSIAERVADLAKCYLSQQHQKNQQTKSSSSISPVNSFPAIQPPSPAISSALSQAPAPNPLAFAPSIPPSEIAANAPSSLFFKSQPSSSPQNTWDSYSMIDNKDIQQRLQEYGLNATVIAWEDNSRHKNSVSGECITDLWLESGTFNRSISSNRKPLAVIRSKNFEDPTIDVSMKDLGSLFKDLNNLFELGGPKTRDRLVMDEEQVIYSKQASILPPDASEFEIAMRNNHALLVVIYSEAAEKPSVYVCREGWHENKTLGIRINGDSHAFKAEHIVDVRKRNNQPLYAPMSQKEEERRQLAIIQIPIKITNEERPLFFDEDENSTSSSDDDSDEDENSTYPSLAEPSASMARYLGAGGLIPLDGNKERSLVFGGYENSTFPSDTGLYASMSAHRGGPVSLDDTAPSSPRKPAFAPAQISKGTKMRRASDYQYMTVTRISRIPLRITIQYYSYLSDEDKFAEQIPALAKELNLKDATSLVTDFTERPTQSSRLSGF
ncbi:MAG: hypothetical protein WB791_10155 [Waddliaceae bacterium]